jgi:hypothetical protein
MSIEANVLTGQVGVALTCGVDMSSRAMSQYLEQKG